MAFVDVDVLAAAVPYVGEVPRDGGVVENRNGSGFSSSSSIDAATVNIERQVRVDRN